MQEMRSRLEKLLLSWFCFLNTFLEFSYAATSIEDALLASVKRMADRADFNE